jgi:hypothetical protein
VAVVPDGVGDTGEAEGVDVGVGLGSATVGDDGRAVGEAAGVGVFFSPPQATARRIAMARERPSQPTTNGFLPIPNLH